MRLGACQYEHDCKALTHADAAFRRAEWAAEEERRAELARVEEREAQRVSAERRYRIEAMLDQFGLSVYDLEEFVKEVTCGM